MTEYGISDVLGVILATLENTLVALSVAGSEAVFSPRNAVAAGRVARP